AGRALQDGAGCGRYGVSKRRQAAMHRSLWIVLAMPAALAAGGCSVTQLTLATPEHRAVSAAAKRPAGGGAREVVLAQPFVDERPIVLRCGMKKNRFGGDTADVLCASPPNVWLAQLLRTELLADGYRVTPVGEVAGPAAIRIDGLLRQFFVEPK